jgi:peptidoglycan/LPS O-acetylase OafA/YrhL
MDSKRMNKPVSYRAEIDGLRAISVMSVMFGHAGFDWCSGGFIGVDVFFVISGFLITGIILDELAAGRFSIIGFYDRRVRRILPALLVVMLVCVPPGWIYMSADAFKNLGESLVATTISANNILLTITSGYWDMESSFKPLLHTWSLGVEEQYYMITPFVLAWAYRPHSARVGWVIAAIGITSFGACLWAMKAAPVSNFYLLPTRAWELAAGAGASFWMRGREETPSSDALSLLGLAGILGGVVLFQREMPSPSPAMLIPVGGAVLVLLFCRKGLAHRLLTLPPIVGIGLISYSAYLWHQPLFAYFRVIDAAEPTAWQLGALIPVSLLLAWLSWRYVEIPFRNRKVMSFPEVALFVGPIALALVVGGGLIFHKTGLPWRLPLPPNAEPPGMYKPYNEAVFRWKKDAFPAGAERKLLVLGNSQGRDFVNIIEAVGAFSDYALVYRDDMKLCDLTPELNPLVTSATLIISVYDWHPDPGVCNSQMLAERMDLKNKIVFIGPKNFGENINPFARLPLADRGHAQALISDATLEAEREYKSTTPSSLYVDVIAHLSPDGLHVPVFDEGGRLLTEDRVHITRSGAVYIGKRIFTDPIWATVQQTSNARSADKSATKGH